MKCRTLAILAATVALPLTALPAAAQQDWRDDDRSYSSDRYGGEREYREYRGSDRYDERRRYSEGRYDDHDDWDRRQVGASRDRWADRPTHDREFDRRDPPPGYRDYRERNRRAEEMASRYMDGQGRRYDDDYRGDRARYDDYGRGGDSYSWRGRDSRGGERREYYTDSRGDRDGYGSRYDGRSGYSQQARYERMGGPGPSEMRRANRTIRTFDSDGDERVTQEEVDTYRSERLKKFDEDQDGQLSIAEYEKLWLDGVRERMVDRFQGHDNDGDGFVTNEEFGAQTSDMVSMRDRDGDGAFSFSDLGPRGGQEFRRQHGQGQTGQDDEDYAGRPEVEAPLGEQPNQSESQATEEESAGESGNTSDNENETN